MKNAMITSAGILVLVVAMATSALGRQSIGDTATMSPQGVAGPAEHATLQVVGSGQAVGIGLLPSTSTQTTDLFSLALLAVGGALAGVVLVRKAFLDR